MRPDVWEPFRQRFNIECINELYAATDGMGACFNANRGPFSRNAIGVRGLYWELTNGVNEKRVLIDPSSQSLLRNAQGFCILASRGEPGEVLHRIDPAMASSIFPGYYKNPSASQKRFIRSVFAKDDMWFRSGDMQRHDASGCVYFVDRLGDTFRWKSENVSTNEVSDVMGQWTQIAEANVYGVLVPNADGRAGCAAIVPTQDTPLSAFDFGGLAEHALKLLPRYAVPIFIRVVRELEYTGTMKLQKGRLREEGIELDKIREAARKKGEKEPDAMFWLPPGGRRYVPFGDKELEEIRGAKVRL
jgi:acyl-CoA synthetase (AMP-forming)/AMP-acid ligase II